MLGSLGVIFEEKLAFKTCKISVGQIKLALMSSNILSKILSLSFCDTKSNTPGFNSLQKLIILGPFRINDFRIFRICSSIRNCITYSNDANIVNKDCPIPYLQFTKENKGKRGNPPYRSVSKIIF